MDHDQKEHFLTLLKPVYPRLSRYAYTICRDSELAKDLVSESVLIALEKFGTLRDDEGFAGFLFQVVSRTHKRNRYRERMRSPWSIVFEESVVDDTAQADQGAELAIIMAALEQLPPKTRETILLVDLADLSLEEARRAQGGTLSGVKSRLRRGHARLRRILCASQVAGGSRADTPVLLIKGVETYAR